MHSWFDVVAEHAHEHGCEEVLEVLGAFTAPYPRGGPPAPPEAPWSGDFDALHRSLVDGGLGEVAAGLVGEVDDAQVQLFLRRAAGADALLAQRDDEAHRVLRAGFRMRLRGILAAPPPRAQRVRALADFYVSASARSSWSHDGPSLFEVLSKTRWTRVHRGIEHLSVDGPMREGPVHLHALRIDPTIVELRVADRRDRATTSLAAEAADRGAHAAISGGFFLYSEPDIVAPDRRYDPVGLLVVDGEVLQSSHHRRPALLVSDTGAVRLAVPSLRTLRVGSAGLGVTRWWTRAQARTGPDAPSLAITAGRVVAAGRALPIPLNGFVVEADPVPLGTPVVQEIDCQQAVAGGPVLVGEGALQMQAQDFWGSAPPQTFSQDETGDANLLPRLGVGLDPDGRLLVVAVDGRNLERAFGLTLAGLGRALSALGAHTALNLDGGSSKRMVLDGRVLDLSTTELVGRGESAGARRPVHSAVFFRAPRG